MTHIFDCFLQPSAEVEVKGSVLLQRKNLFDLNEQVARLGDNISEFLGKKVAIQLVSSSVVDPSTGIGILSKEAYLEDWIQHHNSLTADKGFLYSLHFSLDSEFGIPGAFLITNHHPSEFLLKSLTLELPKNTQIHFSCDSWVYNRRKYEGPRIFFSNQVCLPGENTPPGLRKLRNIELQQLRGNGSGERHRPDRIYDYDVYNDLGFPDKGPDYARQTLGGSKEFPYPRRCRTGRAATKTDPSSERPTELVELVYVPRDERFQHIKKSDFLGDAMKSFAHAAIPAIEDILRADSEFSTMEDLHSLYSQGIDLSVCASEHLSKEEEENGFQHPFEIIKELTYPDSTKDPYILTFPSPPIIQENKDAWNSDEEFARQMLSGLNPIVIERLKVFPPVSKLDPKIYGSPTSAITACHVEKNLEGLTIQEALQSNRLFTVDYHDVYLPYLNKINALKGKGYASRTILFLTKEGILKVVAIELSLPPTRPGENCARRVFVPPSNPGQKNWLWQLARTHAAVNDAGYHQLISHWLRTHATIEPFIIATNRQLSALHPLHVLLKPHFKNTMNINAIARKILINGYTGQFLIGGIIERTFTTGGYSMEMSSVVYRDWRFDEQALPADLIKRGVAIEDPTAKHGLKLLIQDYPFAVDGLDIWFAIRDWVSEYIQIHYENDRAVVEDIELQQWWREIRTEGHGDKAGEKWWVVMKRREELEEVMVILIWLASAHHAVVNFGQYAYAGFMPNKPTMTRRFVPEEGSTEHVELLYNPEKFFLKTVSDEIQAIIVMATLEILSTHASDEEYLGQRLTPNWSSDERVLQAFQRFGKRLSEVEEDIKKRNEDPHLKNRHGQVKLPYTFFMPTSEPGMTLRGIPNSTSI